MANLGLQNNNPGNLKDPATGAFRTFNSVDEGNQALMDDLKIKQSGQSKVIKPGASLQDFANVWAPASDKNDPTNYAKTLATHLGVDTSHPFDQVPADQLAGAIKVAEGTSTPDTTIQKLSVKDFAQKIRDKYSAYQGVDDSTLVTKFLAKYPVYQDRVDTSLSQSVPLATAPKPNPSETNSSNVAGANLLAGSIYDTNMSIEGSTQAVPDESTPNITPLSVGKSLVNSTVETGNDIAAALGGNDIGTGGALDKFNKLAESDRNYLTTLIQLRNKAAQAKNVDETAHFQNLIKNYKTTDNQSVTDLFPALNKSAEQVIGDIAGTVLEADGLASGAQGLAEFGGIAAKTGTEEATKTFAQKLAKGALTGGGYGAGFGAAGAMQNNASPEEVAKSAAVGGVTGAVLGAGTEAVGSGLQKVFGSGKTPEEVIALANDETKSVEEATKGMSSNEKAQYFKAKTEMAKNEAATEIEANSKQFKTDAAKIEAKINEAGQQTGEAARTDANAQKEPARKLFTNMSKQFSDLSETALNNADLSGKFVAQDIGNQIDSKLEHDQTGLSQEIKSDLGIKPPSSTPVPEGETPPEPKPLTAKDMVAKARELMQTIPKAERSGQQVLSASSYRTMQKYATIMDLLGDNGVDLSEANKFWKEWAPLRNKINTQIKPFDLEGNQPAPFAKTLTQANSADTSSATKAITKQNAQKFVSDYQSAIEKSLGLNPGELDGTIDAKTKVAIQKLNQAQLDKLTSKETLDQTVKTIKANLKSETTSTLNPDSIASKKFTAQQKSIRNARIGKIIKYSLQGILGLGGVAEAVNLIKGK